VKQTLPGASLRHICGVLHVARSSLGGSSSPAGKKRPLNVDLVGRLAGLIKQHPTFGYRRLWALLRHREGIRVNRKTIYSILRHKKWFVHQRVVTPRPRVQGWVSRTKGSNQRWAMDLTHIPLEAGGHDSHCPQRQWVDLPEQAFPGRL
jgi:putative transposase